MTPQETTIVERVAALAEELRDDAQALTSRYFRSEPAVLRDIAARLDDALLAEPEQAVSEGPVRIPCACGGYNHANCTLAPDPAPSEAAGEYEALAELLYEKFDPRAGSHSWAEIVTAGQAEHTRTQAQWLATYAATQREQGAEAVREQMEVLCREADEDPFGLGTAWPKRIRAALDAVGAL